MRSILAYPSKGHSKGHRRGGLGAAFTLVEVMVATVLLSMIVLVILQVLIFSYRLGAKARVEDHARYVIKAYAEQFVTQNFADINGNTLPMFMITVNAQGTLSPLGTGMTWTNQDGSPGVVSGDGSKFYVELQDNSGAPLQASVQRLVQYVIPSSGQPTIASQNQAAGYMLRGDFTISFPFQGNTLSQTVSVIRAIP